MGEVCWLLWRCHALMRPLLCRELVQQCFKSKQDLAEYLHGRLRWGVHTTCGWESL